jgi:tRNA U34 5-methylaminomethyl-2-thiouridine-forming methyltransferase MnmC
MAAEALAALHESSESRRIEVERPGISLVVLRTDWLDAEPDSLADALYFDPFGPSANPESWTDAMFEAARARLKPAGRLATYSAAGHVRRAMARAGLVLATRPGPGRKREITVASPADAGLGNLERLSMTRYRREEPT